MPIAVLSTTIARTADSFYGPLVDELRSRGFAVHVVTSPGPEVARLRHRVDAVHLVVMNRRPSPAADVQALLAWLRLMRATRPDLVLAGTPKAALLAMLAARLTGVPRRAYFLQGLRLEGTRGPTRTLLGITERLTSRCAQVVIAVSPSLAAAYLRLGLGSGRPVLVPHHGSSHGVDTRRFAPRSPAASGPRRPGAATAVFLGRLTADKGIDSLVEALQLLRDAGQPVRLAVVGAQDEADSAAYAERLARAGGDVAVVPQVGDVRPHLAAADFLVLPTRREGLPNTVLEAAAMGLPAVTTRATGAVDSVLDGVTGLLVPVDDPGSLAAAMARLAADPGLRARLGAAARDRVITAFQPGDVARAVVDIALAAGSATAGTPPQSPSPQRLARR